MKKQRTGIVVSNKMDKTAVVEVKRTFAHPFYKKVMRVTKKFKAHDEENKCQIGDRVEMIETRPISRDKCWRIVKILGQAKINAHDLPIVKEKKVDTATDPTTSS
ncbi:MAG: 30S ribosomal protein S17 [bacterium]